MKHQHASSAYGTNDDNVQLEIPWKSQEGVKAEDAMDRSWPPRKHSSRWIEYIQDLEVTPELKDAEFSQLMKWDDLLIT